MSKLRAANNTPARSPATPSPTPPTTPMGSPSGTPAGNFAADLSLPRLQTRWAGATAGPVPANEPSHDARQAAITGAAEIRHHRRRRRRRSSSRRRGPCRRRPPPRRRPGRRTRRPRPPHPSGGRLRPGQPRPLRPHPTPPPGRRRKRPARRALALALIRRAGPGETRAVGALIVALAALADAIGELRSVQQRHHQATAAQATAAPLRAAVGATPPPAIPMPDRARTTVPRPGPELPTRGRRMRM